jgi:hypothetical protein
MGLELETLERALGQMISFIGFVYDRIREAMAALTVVS